MSDDSDLKASVLAELNWEPSVHAAHIGVTAHGGIVTLSGHTRSYAEKQAAEAAALRVRGVKAVAQEIEVQLPFETERSDEAIAAAAIERLSWDVSVPKDRVLVRVEKGWVTLSGEVNWFYEKSAPEQDVMRLFGVRGVSNHITVKPQVDASLLSDDIEHALHRSWFFDPKTITVGAMGGHVTLAGTTRTPHERQVAVDTAWSAPGVTGVVDDIAIA